MRILFDQAVYELRNKGNVALLQVAVNRMRRMWPNASLEVIANGPYLLKTYCPEAHPVSEDGRHNWSCGTEKLDRVSRFVPDLMLQSLFEIREEARHGWPNLPKGQLRKTIAAVVGFRESDVNTRLEEDVSVDSEVDSQIHESPDLQQAMKGADLVVATGGGYMCDSDKQRALTVLNRLEHAVHLGKVTAMVGQGIGPIDDPELRERSRSVLPLIDLIMVRETGVAPDLLKSLSVHSERIVMTGDDAVELAYGARPSRYGNGIGVSVRLAHYTKVEHQDLPIIRRVVQQAAANYGSPLVAIPISCDGLESDQKMISELLKGYPNTNQSWRRFESPLDVIRKVGRCRLVVAGAFHAAVFALAQGIPVVGLIKSTEYANKFKGLADQYGPGCQLIRFDDNDLGEKLASTIDEVWQSADEIRPHLLEVAKEQIGLGRAGYRYLFELVNSNQETKQLSKGNRTV